MKIVLYSSDPKTGKKSATLTLLWYGMIIASIKLLLSGMTFFSYTFSEFTGADFAMVIGSLGALYGYRKHTDHKIEPEIKPEEGE